MASTPKSVATSSLNESWVDLKRESPVNCLSSSDVASLEKIMLEVQNDLFQASSSNTSIFNPQIVPNHFSPVSSEKNFFIDEYKLGQIKNNISTDLKNSQSTGPNDDWIWYWKHEGVDYKKDYFIGDKKLNLRQWAIRKGIFSKDILSLLLFTNAVSVVLGVGIGYTALVRRFL